MISLQGEHKIRVAAEKNSKKTKIFLDMDGVVFFWEKAAAKSLGMSIDDPKVRSHLKKGREMQDFVGGDSKMWPIIDNEGAEWWENLEMLPWGEKLYKEMKRLAGDFAFLTSPNKNPLCLAGKLKSLQKHFGVDFKDYMIGAHKHLCASPNAILIDDSEKKIIKFRQYGGVAFHWPNPLQLLDKEVNLEETFQKLYELISTVEGKIR